MKMDFAFLTVAVIICFLSVMARQNTTIFFTTTHSRTKMDRAGSGAEFHLWIGLGRIKKIGPKSNSVHIHTHACDTAGRQLRQAAINTI